MLAPNKYWPQQFFKPHFFLTHPKFWHSTMLILKIWLRSSQLLQRKSYYKSRCPGWVGIPADNNLVGRFYNILTYTVPSHTIADACQGCSTVADAPLQVLPWIHSFIISKCLCRPDFSWQIFAQEKVQFTTNQTCPKALWIMCFLYQNCNDASYILFNY